MVLLSSRLMFVYDQVPISQVKSQTATLCSQVSIESFSQTPGALPSHNLVTKSGITYLALPSLFLITFASVLDKNTVIKDFLFDITGNPQTTTVIKPTSIFGLILI